MRYSTEPRDRIYIKGYGFLSFFKNMSNKQSQKLFDTATDPIKTASKRAIQKTAKATGDLIGNKIADKITNASKNLILMIIMIIMMIMQNWQHIKKGIYWQHI